MKRILFLFLFFIIVFPGESLATNEEIIELQKDSLKISSFIQEANKYTEDIFPDLDMNNFFTAAIKGDINEKTIFNSILNLFGKEIKDTFKLLIGILIIILIHSIFKSVSESLENNSISQITYYVQYILIVTLIMSNFTEIISMIKNTIQNLVGFMNTLTPLLITLMIATRKCDICKCCTTFNFICNFLYRKYYNKLNFTNSFNIYNIWNCFAYFK